MQIKIFEKLPIAEDMEVSENIVTTVDRGTSLTYMNNNNTHAYDFNFSILSFDNANMDSEDISKQMPLTLQFNIGKEPQDEKKNLRRFKKRLRTSRK